MNRTFKEDLEKELQDVEFAREFGVAAAKTDFALTLAKARRICQVTQTDLANLLGTSQSYIAKLERGDANPTIGRIGELLAVLGLRLSTNTIPLISSVYSETETHRAENSGFHFSTLLFPLKDIYDSGIAVHSKKETSDTKLVEASSR